MEIRDVSNSGTLTIVGRDTNTHNTYNTYNTHNYYYGSSMVIDLEVVFRAIPSFRKIHQDMLAKATPGTGVWLLKSDKFRLWLEPNGDLRILWGSGLGESFLSAHLGGRRLTAVCVAGAGKTVLAALVVNVLQDLAKERQGAFCVVYVYFRYSDNKDITVRTVLETLVKQIINQRPDLTTLAQEVYADHFKEGTQPSEAQLASLARQMTDRVPIACLLDALDEAPVDVQFALVKILASFGWKLFITSRPLKTLEAQFPSASFFAIRAREEDVALLIDEKLKGSANLLELLRTAGTPVWEEIEASVKQKCDGMFLHASLQLDAISQCLSLDDVKEALESFPSDIEGAYRQTWTRIMNQDPKQAQLARMVLLWVINAQRSMTIEELRHAVAACPTTYKFLPGSVVPEATLLTLCRGLVTVEEKSDLVRLVHYTAKDLLETLLLESFPQPHALLAAICMTHLTTRGFQNTEIVSQDELEQTLRGDPLLAYAYEAWHFHAKLSLGVEPCNTILAAFVPACQAFPCILDAMMMKPKLFDVFNSLHVAAYYGLPLSLAATKSQSRPFNSFRMAVNRFASRFLPFQIFHSPSDVATKYHGITPLMLACSQGHSGVVEDLVSSANIDAVDFHGRSAVSIAIWERQEECVGLLLHEPPSSHIKLGLEDSIGCPTLIHAVAKGHEACVRLLLARADIDVNLVAASTGRHSPLPPPALITAALIGHEGCAKLLLSHVGIQVNIMDDGHKTALIYAACIGREGFVKLLLAHREIQIDLADNSKSTPLMHAADHGHEECVRLLLTRPDAQVNLVDNDQQTALMRAVLKDHEGCVKLLLARSDVQVNLVNRFDCSALILATLKGHEGCVKLLLGRTDIQVNLESQLKGPSALTIAASNGHFGIVDLILAYPSTRLDLASHQLHSARGLAALGGHHRVVERIKAHQSLLSDISSRSST